MTRRYYVADLPTQGGLVDLSERETQHAIRVMRVQAGDRVELFDGKGHQSEAIVTLAGRNQCQCDAEPAQTVDREPDRRVHLGVALPKGDRAREMIQRLTELGVARVTPLIASRTQRPPSESNLLKLRLSAIEACKQSGRNVVPEIDSPIATTDFFGAIKATGTRWIADQQGLSVRRANTTGDSFTVAIGPEGGWTEQERAVAADHGFDPVSLGNRILRIETAAAAVTAILTTGS